MMKVWDYNIAKDWQPQNEQQWLWYLERKINHDDWHGLTKDVVKKYLPALKSRLDPGKQKMLALYFSQDA